MPWTSGTAPWLVVPIVALFAWLQDSPPNPTAAAPTAPAVAEKPIVIMIDAAHGGSDLGALLTPSTPEKDITLNLARRLKQELNARGILSQLVRDGDVTLSVDQRASAVNTADPALYIALHASSLGGGMRVITAVVPAGPANKGPFLDWQTAQFAILPRSKELQTELVAIVRKTKFPTRALSAPIQPLNNLKLPAIAIEISPTTGEAGQVASSGYQQMICAAVANALASIAPSLRGNRGARP